MRQVQLRNDNELFQFKPCGNNLLPKGSQIVFVRASDFLDKSMQAEALELARDLSCSFLCQMGTKVLVLKAADVVFAPSDGFKEQLIVWVKEIESGDGSVVIFGGTGQFLQFVVSGTGVVDDGDEFEIPTISCGEKLAQCRKAVNGFLHGSPLGFPASIAMFYLTVVFEKGDVIDGGLNAEDERELVVHLDGDRSHGVLDASAFNANVEAIPHFVLIVAVEFASEEGGDVVGFDRMDRRSCQVIVNGRQIRLSFENNVGGVLGLIDAPMIGEPKMLVDGTETPGKFVEFPMKAASLPAVGNLLRPFPIGDLGECVVHQFECDSFALQLQGQPAMTIAVDLQSAGQPGRHSDVAKAQFFIHEIKIVVQAFALIGFQKGLAALFVMPRFECRALFHGRENPDQPRMLAAFGQHFFDPVFLAEVLFTNKFNLDSMIGCKLFSILPQLITERFGKLRVVENKLCVSSSAISDQDISHCVFRH